MRKQPWPRGLSGVYCVRAGDAFKIGRSCDVAQRLRGLQTGSPYEIEFIGVIPGGYERERVIHRTIEPWRIRGEWFRDTPEVRATISVFGFTR